MESRFSRQMKKGVLEMLVLGLVCEQPGHGYELLNRLAVRSGGFLHTREGTLYPILYRLEDGGLVTSRMSAHVAKEPARKYYAITEAGRDALREMYEIWNEFDGHVRSIMEEEQ